MSTGSALHHDLTPTTLVGQSERADERSGHALAQVYRVDGVWEQRTFAELHNAALGVAAVLATLGVRRGDRVALLARTCPEWTICDLAITRLGAISVPVYPTASDAQIQWVLSDSGSRVVIAETAEQVAEVSAMRASLPELGAILAIGTETPDGGPLRSVIAKDASQPVVPDVAVGPDDPFTIVYTSGTTGNPKGCVLTHRNVISVVAMLRATNDAGPGDVLYAYLPLAHLLTRMLQVFCLDTGACIAYSGGDIRAIISELGEVAPTILPSVPALFEKVYAFVNSQVGADERDGLDRAVEVGLRVRRAREMGVAVDPDDERRLAEADDRLFAMVRAAFGGRVRLALTGAAPIAKQILEFFFAAGVPIYEAYGMTESSAVISANLPGAWRAGTVGRPLPGIDVRIDDGEICARSSGVFAGYWKNPEATAETIDDGWLRTGDCGEFDADGYLRITGRSKDIIITSAGKNLTPANLENDLRHTRWIAEAVMLGDHRPHPVALLTLDPEQFPALAAVAFVDPGQDDWYRHQRVHDLIAADVAAVNTGYSPPERIRDFAILPGAFSVESGELTPTFKVRRAVVAENHADVVDALYR